MASSARRYRSLPQAESHGALLVRLTNDDPSEETQQDLERLVAIKNHIATGIVRAEGMLKQADVAVWLSRASYLVSQHQHGGVSDRLFATGTNPVGEGQF